MMANTPESIALKDIRLDCDNPRFSSNFVRTGTANPTQEDILMYLLQNEGAAELAESIQINGGLHPAESIICLKEDDAYIVLEGNRRICACKALTLVYSKGRDWLPPTVKHLFPFVEADKSSDIDLVNTISHVNAIVYKTREAAQPYISDKHIDGVKKWDAAEKNGYFYTLYQQACDENPEDSAEMHIQYIQSITKTNFKTADIKKCVRKYTFFMRVFRLLREKYPDKSIEMNSYLPLVDRFMDTLLGDSDVGLCIKANEHFDYEAPVDKSSLYEQILLLVGEAFLMRPKKTTVMELIFRASIHKKFQTLQSKPS